MELLDRLVDQGQADDRRGEDAVVVVERPVLVHPLVERVDDRMGQHDVVGGALLDQAGKGRIHDALVDTQFVHQLDARRRRLIGGNDVHCLADELTEVQAFGIVAEEVVLGAAGPCHPLEGRVRDHVADVVLDDELRSPVDLDVADLALGAPSVDTWCSASFVSYMWLSMSKTGYGKDRGDMRLIPPQSSEYEHLRLLRMTLSPRPATSRSGHDRPTIFPVPTTASVVVTVASRASVLSMTDSAYSRGNPLTASRGSTN